MSDLEPPVTRTGPQPLQIRQGLTAGSIVAAVLTIVIGVRAGFGLVEYLGSAVCFGGLLLAAHLVLTRVNDARARRR